MSCQEFERLMAEALGDELSSEDRSVFEAHLLECAGCRQEYESAGATVAAMRSLSGSKRVTARREGNRLVIEGLTQTGLTEPEAARRRWFATRAAGGAFRYAAGLLIAFVCGYALHAGLLLAGAVREGKVESPIASRIEPEPKADHDKSLKSVFASTFPGTEARSDLARCLLAMSHRGR